MKILVTGGLGFIGSNFVRYMLPRGHYILNIDKKGIGANPENLLDVEDASNYEFLHGDITDKHLIEQKIVDYDFVVNFAAETHVDRSIAEPQPFLTSNYFGTFRLLEAERKLNSDIRHIQVSTDEVYGDILNGSFVEEDVLKPSNPYAATKAAADILCEAYVRTYGQDVVITRCTNNFGPRQFPEKLIPKTILRALHDLKIPIYGSGEAVRDWLYVFDHCSAIDAILSEGESGEIYNISSGTEVSVINIVKVTLDLLEKNDSLIEHVEDRPGHDMRYSLDSSKIRNTLHWKPDYDFSRALTETVEWYIKNDWWWKPILKDGFIQSLV